MSAGSSERAGMLLFIVSPSPASPSLLQKKNRNHNSSHSHRPAPRCALSRRPSISPSPLDLGIRVKIKQEPALCPIRLLIRGLIRNWLAIELGRHRKTFPARCSGPSERWRIFWSRTPGEWALVLLLHAVTFFQERPELGF
jgi:hypothetical protein